MKPDLTLLVLRARAQRALPPPTIRRTIRESAHLPRSTCARALGVSRQGFTNWEEGTRTPSGEHLDAYLALLSELQQAMAA